MKKKNQITARPLWTTPSFFLFTKNNKAKRTPLIKPLYVECFHMVFRAISHISR